MPIIRRLFGPFMPESDFRSNDIELKWSFFGIKDDYSISNWLLCYKASTRKFSTHFIPHNGLVGRTRVILAQANQLDHPPLDEFKTMFLDDRPVLEAATTTDILRRHLSDEDRAACVAASIQLGGKGT